MSDEKRITVLKDFRPLTDEELSVELSPEFNARAARDEGENHRVLRNNGIDVAKFKEEASAGVTPAVPQNVIPFRGREFTEEVDKDNEAIPRERERSGMALIGVISSVLSLFFLPYLFAPVGIVLGYLGFRKGDHSLGTWAMGLGAIGLLGTLIVSAMVY